METIPRQDERNPAPTHPASASPTQSFPTFVPISARQNAWHHGIPICALSRDGGMLVEFTRTPIDRAHRDV